MGTRGAETNKCKLRLRCFNFPTPNSCLQMFTGAQFRCQTRNWGATLTDLFMFSLTKIKIEQRDRRASVLPVLRLLRHLGHGETRTFIAGTHAPRLAGIRKPRKRAERQQARQQNCHLGMTRESRSCSNRTPACHRHTEVRPGIEVLGASAIMSCINGGLAPRLVTF